MSTSAERMRRCRERQRAGTVLVRILVPGDAVSDLSALGWLPPGSPAKAVPAALTAMLNMAFDVRVAPPRDFSPAAMPRPGDRW